MRVSRELGRSRATTSAEHRGNEQLRAGLASGRPPDRHDFATRYAAVKLEWDLKVAWQNLEFAHDDAGKIYLIENAIAWVELVKPASLNLKVQGSFGVPTFGGNVAKLPVKFWVEVHDGDTPIRNEYRGFEIHGDGNRVRMF